MKVNPLLISISLLFSLMLVTGCQPIVELPTPTSPPETPTSQVPGMVEATIHSSSPTPTISPSPTPDLAALQLDLLYQASLTYLADTDDQAWEVAKSLGYAPLGGYPSNMCGPLAVSLLKDAGILSQKVDLHDFWLLDPVVDADLLQDTFPSSTFEWLHSDQSINKIDYDKFPLQAGDMVYIYSGILGDYSHVLTVTRVDDQGRAFSVTNNYTDEGFIIQEFLLYDPSNPGEGIFYAWTDPTNIHLGITGLGGIEVWRPLQLPYYADGKP